jgi:pyridoxine 5'-phosphate synthase PdxJ
MSVTRDGGFDFRGKKAPAGLSFVELKAAYDSVSLFADRLSVVMEYRTARMYAHDTRHTTLDTFHKSGNSGKEMD